MMDARRLARAAVERFGDGSRHGHLTIALQTYEEVFEWALHEIEREDERGMAHQPQIEVVDTKTLTLTFPTSSESFEEAVRSVGAGYSLTSASEVTSGSQRDPYTVGVKLVFSRRS